MTARCIVAESVFAKNCMLSIHGVSPYQALLGRQPPILQDFEPASATALADAESGIPGISRHIHRLRAAAVEAIVRGSAESQLRRAELSRTRPAAELMDLSVGDSVDFFREPPNKDMSGWSGPAEVCDLQQLRDGVISVRWHGRVINCSPRDVRRAIVLLVMRAVPHASSRGLLLAALQRGHA